MKKKIMAFIMAAATCFSLTACNTDSGSGSSGNSGAGNSNSESSDTGNSGGENSDGSTIDLVVWGPEEDQTFLTGLIEDFQKQYPDQTFNIKLGVESEATAKDTILTDPLGGCRCLRFCKRSA